MHKLSTLEIITVIATVLLVMTGMGALLLSAAKLGGAIDDWNWSQALAIALGAMAVRALLGPVQK